MFFIESVYTEYWTCILILAEVARIVTPILSQSRPEWQRQQRPVAIASG